MPPTLHPYLKRGLDFDAPAIDPSDLEEDVSEEIHHVQDQTAKRRRVEAIALQYLRGRPPLILTARLKGPFTKDWKNPWAKATEARRDGHSRFASERESAEGQGRRRSEASQVPSPEASRGVGRSGEYLHDEPELEPLPATAPLPEDDVSGTTEFFSVETDQFIANNSPANPFWLRRPAEPLGFPPNSQTEKSPTRPREKHRFDSRESLHLALPKEPLDSRSLPIRATPDEWRSSASAPMDISSSAKPLTDTEHMVTVQDRSHPTSSTAASDSSRLRADSAQEDEARSSQAAQYAQTAAADDEPVVLTKSPTIDSPAEPCLPKPTHIQSFESPFPADPCKVPSTVQVPRSSPTRAAGGLGSQAGPSRTDIQRSAERLVELMPRPLTKPQPCPTDRESPKEIPSSKKLRHNLRASPAPDSSTGFMYRRVGNLKGEGSSALMAKPRAVSFSSSPTLVKKSGPSDEASDAVTEVAASDGSEPRTSDMAIVKSTFEENCNAIAEGEAEEQNKVEQQESHRSRQSQYSTQAAMLLAQLEFLEGSPQSSTSSATLRPWSQRAQDTPRSHLPQPSPAFTPLLICNPRTEVSRDGLEEDSVVDGAPVSTQDLFNAASPFAFSTVKKSQRPRRTSLRFALNSKFNESMTVKSPSPSTERVPLKEKNVSTMWSFTHEKSLSSSKLASQTPRHAADDVQLPKLDFHTSLDFGPNADFTDCFLKGLNNEP